MSGELQLRTVSYVLFLFIIGVLVTNADYYPRLADEMSRSPRKHSMYERTRQTSNGSLLDKLVTGSSRPSHANDNDMFTSAKLDQISKLLNKMSDIRAKRSEQYYISNTEKEHLSHPTTTPPLHVKHRKHNRRNKKHTRTEKSKSLERAKQQGYGSDKKSPNKKVHQRPQSKEIALETDGDSRMSSARSRDKYRPRSNKSIRKHYWGQKSEGSPSMNTTQAPPVMSTSQHEQLEEEEVLESLRQMHTELIKEKILRLLRLDKPPEVPKTPLPEFPKPVKNSLLNMAQSDEPDSGEIDHFHDPQAVIFAEDELLPCPQSSAKCVYFKMDKLERQEVLSAELWMFKEYDSSDHYNHTFVIYELGQTSDNSTRPQLRQVVGSLETGIKKGWVKFDILHTVSFWVNKPHRNNGLQILCKNCKTGPGRLTPVSTSVEVRPVLVVEFGQPYRRNRRTDSNICHSGNKICCRQPLTIDFKSINWEHWIVYPKSIQTSYCRGSCERPHRIPTLLSHHSKMILDTNTKPVPCCAPTKMREVSVLARNGLQYIKENLEIKVTQCGCAT